MEAYHPLGYFVGAIDKGFQFSRWDVGEEIEAVAQPDVHGHLVNDDGVDMEEMVTIKSYHRVMKGLIFCDQLRWCSFRTDSLEDGVELFALGLEV